MKRTNLQKYRWLTERLPAPSQRRLVILTGARQTGKTTLAQKKYAGLNYINLDAPENRAYLKTLRTMSWAASVGPAVLDEAQKEPSIFDKVKYVYDGGEINFSVLLGSSQILLMQRIRETLAGRAFLYELFPLMFSEAVNEKKPFQRPLLAHLLKTANVADIFRETPAMLLPAAEEKFLAALDYFLMWGGMPALLALRDSDRRLWLQSYGYSYLERDLGDLARLNDLEPFRLFQKLSALRSGHLLSFSGLAQDSGLSISTSRRYMEYLKLSYQSFLLQPYRKNLTSSAIKTPKLFWMDIGILRHLQGVWGMPSGALFETFVVSEIYKWVHTMNEDAALYFYRTRSGLEVDMLIETSHGIIGLEIKSRKKAISKDCRPLREVAKALNMQWKGGMVITRGEQIELLDANHQIWAVPVHRLLA